MVFHLLQSVLDIRCKYVQPKLLQKRKAATSSSGAIDEKSYHRIDNMTKMSPIFMWIVITMFQTANKLALLSLSQSFFKYFLLPIGQVIVYNTPAYVWKYISNKPFYGNPKGVWLATNDMDIMSLNWPFDLTRTSQSKYNHTVLVDKVPIPWIFITSKFVISSN